MSNKKLPELPKEVGEKYECSITPTVVHIRKPKELAGRYDFRRISLAQAEKLAKAEKYFKKKETATAVKKG
ncbi:hypothetical protein DN752_21075 [Echinicola strongylocentroti]|uniref:Uncharacterized protein n=1 Tax=Echinicola strongylocentroti TaxID=1795355 RepID=A0A2Z4IPF5_9BACT|nr:hypothetical protein [Echinicola strongylocentroti]AWW32436.1 hypothetical protein DN752_21075 [Echinicola strongylocentroti]